MTNPITPDSATPNSKSWADYLTRPLAAARGSWKAEKCRRSLREFLRAAWLVVETEAFVPGWHIDAVCEHLEAVTRGQIRRLLITIPPRFGKSNLVSVFWPVWTWASRPEARWLYASYRSGERRSRK